MKKIIMLAVVLTTLAVSAFAKNPDAINRKVLNSFNKSFSAAIDAKWEKTSQLYKVSFYSAGRKMFAYYNGDGDQVAVTRNISIDQLPLTLSTELKNNFDQTWLTELFEVSSNGETAYYATVESSTHVTILKAEGTAGWAVFSKDKRK